MNTEFENTSFRHFKTLHPDKEEARLLGCIVGRARKSWIKRREILHVMRWWSKAPTASKTTRIHKNYTQLEYYPETTEEQANVFKKGILQSGKLLWLSYEMKNYSELGDVICLGLRPQLACSGRSDGREWREMESWAQKRERGEGGGREKGRGREKVLSPTLPTPTPSLCFPDHFSLSRSHYLNAWNRIDRFSR